MKTELRKKYCEVFKMKMSYPRYVDGHCEIRADRDYKRRFVKSFSDVIIRHRFTFF